MNTQLFHDLAASEEASGYPENAAQLRAVPDVVAALDAMLNGLRCTRTIQDYHAEREEACVMARAALAAMDATTTKEVEV